MTTFISAESDAESNAEHPISRRCNIKSPASAKSSTVGIIGGGIAGSTIALRLGQLGIKVVLIEKGPSLVNGPPICHLHAGGNLYREISQQQCTALLKQSIEMLRLYPDAADYRPTVIAVPQRDNGSPDDLLARLKLLQREYAKLVAEDPDNRVLGNPDEYYQLFSREQIKRLAQQELAPDNSPTSLAQWMIPVAKNLDLEQLKFPLIMVQEYGLSVFRLAATASLALNEMANCRVLTKTKVVELTPRLSGENWQIIVQDNSQQAAMTATNTKQSIEVDYLINACGYRTGVIDDLIGEKCRRMVEFKAAYVTRWPECDTKWPEVIFYGERGTPNGMAQLTPYPDGYFQIHGMTQDITLFDRGLVSTTGASSQPRLADKYIKKLTDRWPPQVAKERTDKSISYMANFIPGFATAEMAGNPLFGAQQIPGQDPSLRAADVSFGHHYYARCEIVKASSALTAANSILNKLIALNIVEPKLGKFSSSTSGCFAITHRLDEEEISQRASEHAIQRNYPVALAGRNTNQRPSR